MVRDGAPRRAHQRLPGRARRRDGRLHLRPPDAAWTARYDVPDGVLRAGRRRRPPHPRRAVHARGVRAEGALGPLHRRLRRARRRRRRAPSGSRCSTTTRATTTTSSTPCSTGRRACVPAGADLEVMAAAEGLTVTLADPLPDPYASSRIGFRSRGCDRPHGLPADPRHVPDRRRHHHRRRPPTARWAWPSGRSRRCRSTRRWSGSCPTRARRRGRRSRPTGSFCVNILAADQLHVCRAFASKAADKYQSLEWRTAATGSPVLDGVVAWIDCTHRAGRRGRRPLVRARPHPGDGGRARRRRAAAVLPRRLRRLHRSHARVRS